MSISRKSLVCALCALALARGAARAAVAEDSRIFTPYFNMTLYEGLYLPSQGNFFSGGVIDSDFGLLSRIDGHNSILALYALRYAGPAFQPQDGRQFQERTLNHSFSAEYRRALDNGWVLRPGLAYTQGYAREGANESWADGLYNMNSYGFQLAADYNFGWFDKAGSVTPQYLYRRLHFPNYTDLIAEFEGAGSSSELSGGQQDQDLHQLSVRANWRGWSGGVSYSHMGYLHQKTIGSDGVYGSRTQADHAVRLDAGWSRKLGPFEPAPSLSYNMFRSNQSFMRYKYFGAVPGDLSDPSADVTLIPDAYSYNELAFALPVDIDLGMDSDWDMNCGVSVTYRSYVSRPPRDSRNNYLSGTQKNTLLALTAGFKRRINEIADMRLTYTFTVGSSNNHYETYLPYNYNGHNLGISYSLSF